MARRGQATPEVEGANGGSDGARSSRAAADFKLPFCSIPMARRPHARSTARLLGPYIESEGGQDPKASAGRYTSHRLEIDLIWMLITYRRTDYI